MNVTVNERPVGAEPDEQATLQSLLDGLRRSGRIADDHVVVTLSVDECPWGADDLRARLHAPLDGVNSVAIATEGMQGYARRILTDASSMLAVLCDAAARVAEEFRTDTPQKASADLFNLLDALQRFLFCLSTVQNTCVPEAEGAVFSGPAAAHLSDSLDALRACQEEGDWERLAAQLDDRLLPALLRFQGVVDDLKGRL